MTVSPTKAHLPRTSTHSETKVSGLFYDLFRTAMDTRVMPESYIHYDVVPVDYVSRGIIALCAGVDNFFEVYHLTNPDATVSLRMMKCTFRISDL